MAHIPIKYQFFVKYSYLRTDEASFPNQREETWGIYNSNGSAVAMDDLEAFCLSEISSKSHVLQGNVTIQSVQAMKDNIGNSFGFYAGSVSIIAFNAATMAAAIVLYEAWKTSNQTASIICVDTHTDSGAKENIVVTFAA